jgi:hypothetical protein
MFIWRNAIPMAPEEHKTTRCPSWRRLTAVSTIVDREERRGSWVFSSTMEDVPAFSNVNMEAQLLVWA